MAQRPRPKPPAESPHRAPRATLVALGAAVERLAGDMHPQDVAHCTWSYATLNEPLEVTSNALDMAARRVAPDMSAQNLANTVWA